MLTKRPITVVKVGLRRPGWEVQAAADWTWRTQKAAEPRGLKIDPELFPYIVLEAQSTSDHPEVRDFQQDLRACTEDALTGSDDQAYSEAKFLEVSSSGWRSGIARQI